MIVVWSEEKAPRESALLAARLGVPLVEMGKLPPEDTKFILFHGEGALFLQALDNPEFKPFFIDYLSKEFHHRLKSSSGNDLLLKACGLKKGNRTVLDASFGLGYDSLFLNYNEFIITGCERNKFLSEFALDALARLKEEGGLSDDPPQLYLGDVREYLKLYPEERFDVVYFDPMYPEEEGGRSALARKEMRMFRDLVGDDLDAGEIFPFLEKAAIDRVVIKRPFDAPTIVPESVRKVDIVFPGKSVRFDVYLIGRNKA